jgi:uncharacterized protein (UPF0333 family)
MKLLIAAACVTAIAGVSYFVWRDVSDRKSAIAAAKEMSIMLTCNSRKVKEQMPAMYDYCIKAGYVKL